MSQAVANDSSASTDKARLELPDQTIELPVIVGTENEKAVDVSKLRSDTGYITLDEGYRNTGSVRPRSPSSTAKRASSATAGSRSRTSAPTAPSSKPPCC